MSAKRLVVGKTADFNIYVKYKRNALTFSKKNIRRFQFQTQIGRIFEKSETDFRFGSLRFMHFVGAQKELSPPEAWSVSKGENERRDLGPTLRAVLSSCRTELSWCTSSPLFIWGQPQVNFLKVFVCLNVIRWTKFGSLIVLHILCQCQNTLD